MSRTSGEIFMSQLKKTFENIFILLSVGGALFYLWAYINMIIFLINQASGPI
jgi:hypothetical protein